MHSSEESHSMEDSDSRSGSHEGHHDHRGSHSHEGHHGHSGSHSHEGHHGHSGSHSHDGHHGSHSNEGSDSHSGEHGGHHGALRGNGDHDSSEEDCWLSDDGWKALYFGAILAVIVITIVVIVLLIIRRRKRQGKTVIRRYPAKSTPLGEVVITPGSGIYGVTVPGLKSVSDHYVVTKDTDKILPNDPAKM